MLLSGFRTLYFSSVSSIIFPIGSGSCKIISILLNVYDVTVIIFSGSFFSGSIFYNNNIIRRMGEWQACSSICSNLPGIYKN